MEFFVGGEILKFLVSRDVPSDD